MLVSKQDGGCLRACLVTSVISDSMRCYGLYSLPGSSVHGILQARILEWAAVLSPPRDLPDLGIEPLSFTSTCMGRWVLYH